MGAGFATAADGSKYRVFLDRDWLVGKGAWKRPAAVWLYTVATLVLGLLGWMLLLLPSFASLALAAETRGRSDGGAGTRYMGGSAVDAPAVQAAVGVTAVVCALMVLAPVGCAWWL